MAKLSEQNFKINFFRQTIIGFHPAWIFAVIFIYFMAWAMVKPPLQTPDENAHAVKAYSVTKNLWITERFSASVHERFYNPILYEHKLYSIPFHQERKISADDIERMKSVEWRGAGGWRVIKRDSPAFSYPNVYYAAVFMCGEFFTFLFQLTPYESFFLYRIVTAFFAALLWVRVYHAMGSIPGMDKYRNEIMGAVILIPMLGFISSSINPDAVFIPLCSLVMIYSYHALSSGTRLSLSVLLLVLAAWVKPAALVLFPTLAVITGYMMIVSQDRVKVAKRGAFVIVAGFAVSFFGFYFWSKPVLNGTPVHITLIQYISDLPHKLFDYFIMYWGSIGNLDVIIDAGYYKFLLLVICVNFIFVARDYRAFINTKFGPYALLFSVIFCCGIIAGEYHYLPVAGYTIQGRYFLPVVLGLTSFLMHRFYPARFLFLVYLAWLNIYLAGATIDRFLGGDMGLLWQMLPLT